MSESPTLGDLATFITSKNAGPYLVTVDVVFARAEDLTRVRDDGVLTPAVVAGLYGCPEADVLKIVFFDPARALKVTLRRPVPSGAAGDTDVYGAQQHVPLMQWRVPTGARTAVDAGASADLVGAGSGGRDARGPRQAAG